VVLCYAAGLYVGNRARNEQLRAVEVKQTEQEKLYKKAFYLLAWSGNSGFVFGW